MVSCRFVSRAWNRPLFALLSALTAAIWFTACQSKPAAPASAAAVSNDTWATVDGRQITRDAVEKAYRRTRDASQTLSEEEILAGKLSLLNDLIVQDILVAKAAALKLERPSERARHRLRERQEERPGRDLSAGADQTEPDGG